MTTRPTRRSTRHVEAPPPPKASPKTSPGFSEDAVRRAKDGVLWTPRDAARYSTKATGAAAHAWCRAANQAAADGASPEDAIRAGNRAAKGMRR